MNAFEAQPIALDGHTTVPGLFWHRVTTKPDKVAMREKDRGIWKAYTWGQYGEAAKAIGSGLIALGLQPGERAAILSDNNKEWLFCDLGVLCAAGVSTGIYPDRLAGAGRVSDQRLRRQVPVRGGRGAARQDPGRARAHAGPAEDHRVRHGGPAQLLRPAGDVARGAAPRSARRTRASTRANGRPASPCRRRATWRSSSTPRARPARPRARCSPTATSSSRWAPSSASACRSRRPTRR